MLGPHLLRRLKRDVLKQLPPKREQIVRVELAPLQKDLYRGILARNLPSLVGKDGVPGMQGLGVTASVARAVPLLAAGLACLEGQGR